MTTQFKAKQHSNELLQHPPSQQVKKLDSTEEGPDSLSQPTRPRRE